MKNIFKALALLLVSVSANAQNPVLTHTNVTGSNSITCSTPSLNFVAGVSNYSNTLSFLWSNGSAVQTGSNVMLGSGGQYTLMAYNTAAGFSVTQTFNISTNTTVPVSAVSPTNQNIACLSPVQTVTATSSPTNNITHNFYSPAGVMASATSYTAIYTPGAPGTYTHCLINNTNGCSTCKNFTVQGSNFPTLTVTNPVANFTLGCGSFSSTTIHLQGQANPPSNNPVSYTVVPGFGPPPSGFGSSTLAVINYPGWYNAIIRDDVTQCQASVPFSVFQGEAPVLNYSMPTQSLNCYTPSVVIQAAGTGTNINYQWQFAGGSATGSSYTATATASISNPVAGNFTLTATDLLTSCTTRSVITLYQNLFPPAVSVPGTHAITCATPSVVLTFIANSTIPPVFFNLMPVVNETWQGPPPQPLVSASVTYTAATPGVYTVTAKDLNNGCLSRTTTVVADNRVYVTLNPSPVFGCPDPTVTISPSINGSTANLSYAWTVPTGANVTGVTSASLTTDTPGSYVVAVSNSYSCVTTAAIDVATCTGINTGFGSNTDVKLYPNPVHSLLTITLGSPANNAGIEIYNTLGACVKKQPLAAEETVIDLKNEANGVYFVYVLNNNKTVSVSKIVKQ